jgi:Carboxypeptidase regulatory-like domain
MTLQPLRLPSVLLLIGLSFSNGVGAQTATSGGLTGVVTDPSDAVVPDANVELKDNAKGTTLSTTTNAEGAYLFSFLLPGSYTLSVTHASFRTATRALDVLLGPPATLNMRLVIASASNTINVTEESPLIKAENGDVSTTMDRQQVSQVPNPGNDLTYIAQTAPGTIMNTDGGFGNFSILGMPGTSNLFTLNGLNDNDFGGNVNITGALNLLLGTNEIQETTLVANGYSGQFGGAAGANVNYITKSGGNDFHGNAVYFWNGRVLNANDWINKAFGNSRPFDNANQWAGSIGGPIKKDKLFFFFDTEGLRVIIPLPFQVVLPSPQFEAATIANISSIFGPTSPSNAFYKQMFNLYNNTPGASAATPGGFSDPFGCTGFVGPNGLGTTVPCAVHFLENIGRPSDQALLSGRVDWNIGPNDRAFLLVQYDHGFQASYTDAISPLFDADSNQPSWQGQLIETHAFGPTATNQILVAGWWQGKIFKLANPSQTLSAFPTTLDWNFTTSTFTNLGGVDNSLSQGRNATRFQISEDFVKTWGNQQFGLGVSFLRAYVTDFAYASNAIGQLIPLTLDAFYQGGVDPGFLEGTDPNPDFTLLNQSFPQQVSQRITFYRLGLYGQDEWHARTNVTLTLALRAEHQSNPVCQRRCFARLTGPFESVSHDPDQPYNQAILIDQKQAFQDFNSLLWSPRFSFAWQPFGVSHNIVVRGGIGIFYDPLPAALINFFSSNPPVVNSFTIHGYSLTPDESNSLFKNASVSNAAFVNGFAAGQTLAQIEAVDSNFSPPSIAVPNNKTYSPQYQKWSLEVQQAFGTATSVSIGYYGNHGIHELIFNPSANAFGFGPFPAGLCASPPVPPCADPRFSDVTEITTPGVSNYNGMVASFQHRFTGAGQGLFQANYTYGHALDEVSNGGYGQFTIGSSIFPQDPYNLRGSYGPADYDVRHSFNANYVWQVPVKAALRGHGSDYLAKGWQISGTIFARTGFPYTVIDGAEASELNGNNFFGTIYAVPVGPLGSGTSCGEGAAIPVSPHPCQPPQVLAQHSPNPNALFVQAGCETGFNAGNLPGSSGPCSGAAVSFAQGRNRFRGPSYFNTDFAIMKNTKIPGWEKGELGIGFQFFNFFNHPNFGLPDNNLSDPGFGRIFYMESPPTSILGAGLGGDASPRNIQLKVQLHF